MKLSIIKSQDQWYHEISKKKKNCTKNWSNCNMSPHSKKIQLYHIPISACRSADLWDQIICNPIILIGIHTNRDLICTTIAGFHSKAPGKQQTKENKVLDPLSKSHRRGSGISGCRPLERKHLQSADFDRNSYKQGFNLYHYCRVS